MAHWSCAVLVIKNIAQLVAYRLGTGEVPGSNPGKGENFSVKISLCAVSLKGYGPVGVLTNVKTS